MRKTRRALFQACACKVNFL